MSKHYIRLDIDNNIIKGFSDVFEQPIETDMCINQDGERHFELNGEVNPSLTNIQGIYIYRYVNDEVVVKTDEEIQQEINSLPVATQNLTLEERVTLIENLQLQQGGLI